MKIQWEASGATHVGRVRRSNEDSFLVDDDRGIFLVADGMGGHAAGEVASALATRIVGDTLAAAVDRGSASAEFSELLDAAFQATWQEITEFCSRDPRKEGMGTTLTVCLLRPDTTGCIGHIGDSRAYRLRDGQLKQLTRDHTWVQREVDAGRLSAGAAESHPLSHILTRVLAAELPPDPDVLTPDLVAGDLLLLSTDGLHGLIPDPEIQRIASQELPLPDLVDRLLQAANQAGGRDNVTVVGVRVLEG
jgi:PPM family protein phosphatase